MSKFLINFCSPQIFLLYAEKRLPWVQVILSASPGDCCALLIEDCQVIIPKVLIWTILYNLFGSLSHSLPCILDTSFVDYKEL